MAIYQKVKPLSRFLCCNNYWNNHTAHFHKSFPSPPVDFTYEFALTEDELNAIEKNIILRQHKNNIPQLRALFQQLTLNPKSADGFVELQKQLAVELRKLPNTTHRRLLEYGDEPREMLSTRPLPKPIKKPLEFSEVCKTLNLLRMDHLGNYSGHKSYYLVGPLAMLESALIKYALKTIQQNDFNLISVPDILPKETIEGCGMQTEGDRTQVYKLETGLCLSGTSEMALAGYFQNQIIDENDLPIKVCAVSRCYRAETSSLHEEKGIFRVHQFTKVEMFSVCKENQSDEMLESFKDIEVSLFQNLNLNFRLFDMPPSELGAPAYQKYDIEAWMAGREMWGEISSCSNCTDYQAKRLNIQYRTKDGQLKFVHTVNGTAAAIPRLLIAVIESNQTMEDTIKIPHALRSYIDISEIKKDKRLPELKLIKNIKSDT